MHNAYNYSGFAVEAAITAMQGGVLPSEADKIKFLWVAAGTTTKNSDGAQMMESGRVNHHDATEYVRQTSVCGAMEERCVVDRGG